ncbi:hypothetical protein P171DRAFT_437677 [Karstenula rhodostoma CBS 690.94]|uniref:Ubiquitin-like protease family profile domain-containing protein n=1 Tax=Karstenula rhodostoma CBS 690.94 TaxID=1392251 RepID=A0A9P4P3G5_9PLEO|nr:hypothetical protein P171DRAFT_437677 [Karstenula rhodostoma CBS 690.94]
MRRDVLSARSKPIFHERYAASARSNPIDRGRHASQITDTTASPPPCSPTPTTMASSAASPRPECVAAAIARIEARYKAAKSARSATDTFLNAFHIDVETIALGDNPDGLSPAKDLVRGLSKPTYSYCEKHIKDRIHELYPKAGNTAQETVRKKKTPARRQDETAETIIRQSEWFAGGGRTQSKCPWNGFSIVLLYGLFGDGMITRVFLTALRRLAERTPDCTEAWNLLKHQKSTMAQHPCAGRQTSDGKWHPWIVNKVMEALEDKPPSQDVNDTDLELFGTVDSSQDGEGEEVGNGEAEGEQPIVQAHNTRVNEGDVDVEVSRTQATLTTNDNEGTVGALKDHGEDPSTPLKKRSLSTEGSQLGSASTKRPKSSRSKVSGKQPTLTTNDDEGTVVASSPSTPLKKRSLPTEGSQLGSTSAKRAKSSRSTSPEDEKEFGDTIDFDTTNTNKMTKTPNTDHIPKLNTHPGPLNPVEVMLHTGKAQVATESSPTNDIPFEAQGLGTRGSPAKEAVPSSPIQQLHCTRAAQMFLAPPQWLNDICMDTVLFALGSDLNNHHIVSSGYMAQDPNAASSLQLDARNLLIVSMIVDGFHWNGAVIDMRAKTIAVFDPYGPAHAGKGVRLVQGRFQRLIPGIEKYQLMVADPKDPVYQEQNDQLNCGIYVLIFLLCKMHDMQMPPPGSLSIGNIRRVFGSLFQADTMGTPCNDRAVTPPVGVGVLPILEARIRTFAHEAKIIKTELSTLQFLRSLLAKAFAAYNSLVLDERETRTQIEKIEAFVAAMKELPFADAVRDDISSVASPHVENRLSDKDRAKALSARLRQKEVPDVLVSSLRTSLDGATACALSLENASLERRAGMVRENQGFLQSHHNRLQGEKARLQKAEAERAEKRRLEDKGSREEQAQVETQLEELKSITKLVSGY